MMITIEPVGSLDADRCFGRCAAHLRRVKRFADHRAASGDDQRWAARLYNELDAVFKAAVSAPGASASLRLVDERRRISSKTAGRAGQLTLADGPQDARGSNSTGTTR